MGESQKMEQTTINERIFIEINTRKRFVKKRTSYSPK